MSELNSKENEAGKTEREKTLQTPSLEDLVAMIDSETKLDQPAEIPEDILTQQYFDEKAQKKSQFVRFSLNKTIFGINLLNTMEVGQLTNITPLPNLPQWILGISNIRGEILSIVDLKSFFEWPAAPVKKNNPIIILHNEKIKIGILVDRIMGTLSLDQNTDMQKLSFDSGKSTSAVYIKGVTKSKEDHIYILDVNKLLASPQMADV